MKEVLIITSYYPPETGAASNRIFQLAKGLKKHNFNVSILTPLPNYPKGKVFDDYKGKVRVTVIENSVTVHRLWIYANNSKNKLLRLLSMSSYSLSLIWFFVWNKIPEKVIVQSPPLLVAFTCMLFLKKKKRKLILNVSDLWPMAGLELSAFKKNFSYKLLEKIEYFNYKTADLILGQSEEILSHIKNKFPKKRTFLYRNYPDFVPPKNRFQQPSEGKIKLVYAGLLGIAQGIYKLCKELDYSNLEFHIFGAGPEQKLIESFVRKNDKTSIFYHGEISRNELHSKLAKYDLAIIPLLNRIYGSVPSKIFEYATLGLPMVYFGGGEGESIIKENALGWVAESGNYTQLNKLIASINTSDLQIKARVQKSAIRTFNFNAQLEELSKEI
ncbi:glycosyltransferase family 4 protein [Hanstruepera marina]|uniref:glycosyltransferase family 4 protein n=1 Tax=Hanstruepera marina TaxID=2873265 RepID=UPI001CA67DA2|nr:glycosyltransferase family 4 protein [Hanstruepera marina]